jgi:predicted RNase H-like HicB family nuclease
MAFEILVKPTENGFLATVPGLPDCTVEAATREEAIERVRQEAKDWIERSEIIPLELPEAAKLKRSPKDFVGMWEHNELFDEFQKEIQQYRAELDAQSEAP